MISWGIEEMPLGGIPVSVSGGMPFSASKAVFSFFRAAGDLLGDNVGRCFLVCHIASFEITNSPNFGPANVTFDSYIQIPLERPTLSVPAAC